MASIKKMFWQEDDVDYLGMQIEPCQRVIGPDSGKISTWADFVNSKSVLKNCRNFDKCADGGLCCDRFKSCLDGGKRKHFMRLKLNPTKYKFKKYLEADKDADC